MRPGAAGVSDSARPAAGARDASALRVRCEERSWISTRISPPLGVCQPTLTLAVCSERQFLAALRGEMQPAGNRRFGFVHRTDLLEDRHQVEVVAKHLDLAVLDLEH